LGAAQETRTSRYLHTNITYEFVSMSNIKLYLGAVAEIQRKEILAFPSNVLFQETKS
jgi:hypothetical protein